MTDETTSAGRVPTDGTAENAADGTVTVSIGRTRYETRVLAGRHEVVADEPGALGGGDLGPSPYDLLLSSIGACKVITARMYADRKGWAVDAIEATLRHVREGDHERVEVRLEIRGAVDDEQRERIRAIAEKCPVQRTVTGDLRVETSLASGG